MAKNSQNIRIGAAEIFVNDGSGEVSIGHTLGGVDFMVDRELTKLTVDQYGSAALDYALNGNMLKFVVRLAEITKENLARALPEGKFSEGTGGDSKIGIGRDSGYMLSQDAVEMRLHPVNLPDSNRNEDIYIWKAVSVETVQLDYRVDDQRVLEVTFEALIDESQPEGFLQGRIGDNTIS